MQGGRVDFWEVDYYPFGAQLPGRTYNAGNSSYGYNGKRKDNEIYGEGNFYDYGMRGYDPRIGRFWGIDPLTKKYPWYSPYQYAGNSPIKNVDLDGLEPAGNQGDWEVVPGSVSAYTASHKTAGGKTVIARAEQQKVKDKAGFTGWITHFTWQETSNGLTVKANDYSWYNEDPKMKMPSKDVGRWQRFETEIIKTQKQIWENADNIGKATFGAAFIGTALPAAAYMGGPFLNSFSRVGLAKGFVGGVTDIAAQKTVDPSGPINWWSVGANTIFANPFMAGAVSAAGNYNIGGKLTFSDAQTIGAGFILDGSLGAIFGKLNLGLPDRKFVSLKDLSLRSTVNLLPEYWGATSGNMATNAAQNSGSSNQTGNATSTNNELPLR